MTDLRAQLRDADPLRTDGGMPLDDVDVMRRRVVDEVQRHAVDSMFWPRPMLLAATIALTLAAGVVVGRRLPPPDATTRNSTGGPASTVASASSVDRRQLQFSTPGGTRIIWVFDPEFNP